LEKMPTNNFIRTFLGSFEVSLSNASLAINTGYVILVHRDDAESVWNLFLENSRARGVLPAGLETFEILRIEAGTPLYPDELNENVNPLEVGNLEAISFNKGCYVGQEVVARLQTYDKVRRRLVGLMAESKLPSGSKVYAGAQSAAGNESEIGVVTSSVRSPGLGKEIALAYISMQQVSPGSKYSVRAGAKNIEAELSTLPFIA
jgi:folate-binding protein YgfZ